MKILIVQILLLISLSSCKKNLSIVGSFDVRFEPLERGYVLYYKEEGIRKYIYSIGFNDSLIIVKSSSIPQSEISGEQLDSDIYGYHIISKNEFARYYSSPVNYGVKSFFIYEEFIKEKSLIDPRNELNFEYNFDREPLLLL